MNSEFKKEVGVGVFFLVLAIAYMAGASTISTFTPFGNRGLDSRSVPELLGTLTIILSVLHLVQVFLKARKLKNQSPVVEESSEDVCDFEDDICVVPPRDTVLNRIDKVISLKLLTSFVFLAVYTALYQPLGFILSSIFFLIAESLLLTNKKERKKWVLFIVLFSVGVSVVIYFIFTKYLTLVLPSGILG